MKLCECGCGQPTRISATNNAHCGDVKGQPRRFLKGHWSPIKCRLGYTSKPRKHSEGYVVVYEPDNPASDVKGNMFQHIAIASRVLGRPLPPKACVHHVNGIRSENRHSNLVICENQAYHCLLHKRERAVRAGYPAAWLRCWRCQQYGDPAVMRLNSSPMHDACKKEYENEIYYRLKARRKAVA